jgi:hypothetical protein
MAQLILVKAPLGTLFVDNVFYYTEGSYYITFNPANGSNNVPVTVNPSLTFSAPVVKANGSPITNGDIPLLITFKKTDAFGASVPFTGTIDAEKKVITIIPNSNLINDQVYYLALNNLVIKFQDGDLIAGESITFTTIAPIMMSLYDNFDNPSALTWGFWDNQAGGILNVEANNPTAFSPVNTTPIAAKYTKEAGSDPFTHAFAILGGKLNLSINNQFEMFVYSANAGSVFALKLQNNDIPDPWTTEVSVEHTIQTAGIWEVATYDFSAHSARTDLDKVLLMINPGQTGAGVHYFDEVYGPPFTPPAASPVVIDAYTNNDGTAIEVLFDKDMEPEPLNEGNFHVFTGGLMNPVVSTYRKPENHSIIVLNLITPVEPVNEITLSYLMSGTITSLDNGVLQPFDNYSVTNTLITLMDLRVLLEGPYNGFNMSLGLNPAYLPLSQPYNAAPWNYAGTESVPSIPNPNIVDWLLIEVRDAPNAALATNETMVIQQAAFLNQNGKVVSMDGSSALQLDITIADSMFVVIWHRNHLKVLSSYGLVRTNGVYSLNFSIGAGQAYGGGQKNIGTGVWGMYSGNGLADDQIDDLDKTAVWGPESGKSGYLQGDYNMDGQVDNLDKNGYWLMNNGTTTDEYQLIWQDEFDVDGAPDPDYWTFDIGTGNGGWGNGELQYYTGLPANVKVENGTLLITARNESYQGSNYTSGRIKTEGKFAFQYGRVDIRTKLPGGEGIWPANWMLGSNFSTIGWPACGEIDIMEYRGADPDIIHGAIHTPSSFGGTVNHATTTVANAESEFHIYSIEWDDTKIRFMVDYTEFYVYEPAVYNSSTWPFDAPCFILLNVAVGGSFGGWVNNSIFPQTMEIDYVRVYQKNNK